MKITALHIYPVKSLRGIAVQKAQLTSRGLRFDRRWMLTEPWGRALTQRTAPTLSLFTTAIVEGSSGAQIVITAPDGSTFTLPTEFEQGASQEVTLWSYSGKALRYEEASAWMSEKLNKKCLVVFMPENEKRLVNQQRGGPNDIVSFADGYPLLLTSEESLADLNRRLESPLPMSRFRPNVVVTAGQAFAEDTWRRMNLGTISFRNVKPCDRCVMTTIDPTTAAMDKEPLRTLSTFRKKDNEVWFGVNLIPDSEGILEVGQSVQILESQPPWITPDS